MIDVSTNKNFCPAPWLSLYVEPSGTIDNCCVARNNLGNIKDSQDINKILTENTNLGIQQAMIDNQVVPGCAWCHGTADNLQTSFITDYSNLDKSFYQAGSFKLKYLDARWSNTCNLACVYCNEECSSLWAQEKNYIPIKNNNKNKFLEYVLDNVESLERVQLAGGEPLLLKENELLIDEIISRNPTCNITINTNLTTIDNKIYQQLIALKNRVTWLVSFEATGDQYEYIRYPGKWSVFENNLRQLKRDIANTHTNIFFNMVFLSLNAMSYWDTVDWSLDFIGDTQPAPAATLALYNNGVFPGTFDPRALSIDYRKQVLDRMQKGNYSGLRGYDNIVKCLASTERVSVYFTVSMQQLDSRRNLNSRQLFSDVYKSIESNL